MITTVKRLKLNFEGASADAHARSGQRPATENVAYPCENDPRAEVEEVTGIYPETDTGDFRGD